MNEIEERINELIRLIRNQEEVKRYNEIEKMLMENDYVKQKIEEFKKYQKRIVIYESHHNKIPDEVEERYEGLYKELLEIPVFNEYITLQNEINELFQTITSIIETEINQN